MYMYILIMKLSMIISRKVLNWWLGNKFWWIDAWNDAWNACALSSRRFWPRCPPYPTFFHKRYKIVFLRPTFLTAKAFPSLSTCLRTNLCDVSMLEHTITLTKKKNTNNNLNSIWEFVCSRTVHNNNNPPFPNMVRTWHPIGNLFECCCAYYFTVLNIFCDFTLQNVLKIYSWAHFKSQVVFILQWYFWKNALWNSGVKKHNDVI